MSTFRLSDIARTMTTNTTGGPPPYPNNTWNINSYDTVTHANSMPPPVLLLAYRLGCSRPDMLPFKYLDVGRKSDGTHVVFLISGNEAMVLEDPGLFPSDKLINQLRLIMPRPSVKAEP